METPKAIEWRLEEKKKGTDCAKAILKNLNVMGTEAMFTEGFIEEILTSHLTLQQNFGRTVRELLLAWADSPYVDGRNKGIVTMARACKTAVEESHLPFV